MVTTFNQIHRLSRGLFFSLFFLISSALRGEIDLVALKGLTCPSIKEESANIIKKEYESISPTLGALFFYSPFLKNIHNFAPNDEPLARLVRELFHIHVDGTFDVTRKATHIPYYFTAQDIGALVGSVVNVLKEYQPTLQALYKTRFFKKDVTAKTLLIELKEKLVDPVTAYIKEEMVIPRTRKIKEELKKDCLINEIAKIQKDLNSVLDILVGIDPLSISKDIAALHKKQSELEAEILKKERVIEIEESAPGIKNTFLHSSVNKFGKLLASVVQKELLGVYPAGTTVGTLLAFLWKKAVHINEVQDYLQQLAQTLNIPTYLIYNWPHEEWQSTAEEFLYERSGTEYKAFKEFLAQKKSKDYTIDDYNRLKSITNPHNIQNLSIDDLVFVRLGYELYDNPLPPKVDMIGNAIFEGISFSNCGENSLQNFIAALLWNQATKKFDAELLEKLNLSNRGHQVVAFYQKYRGPEKLKSNEAHDDWASIVSGIPNVKYNNQNKCNIRSGLSNMLNVINGLFPDIGTLENLATELDNKLGIRVDLQGDTKKDITDITLTIQKPNSAAFTLTWHFNSGHFELDFPPLDVIPFAATYTTALLSESIVPLSHAILCGLFGSNYTMLNGMSILKDTNVVPYLVPLESDFEKIMMAFFIAHKATISEHDKIFVLNLSNKLPRDYSVVRRFLEKVIPSQDLCHYVFSGQKDSLNRGVAAELIIDRGLFNLSECALETLSSSTGYGAIQFIRRILKRYLPGKYEKEARALVLKLYEWASKPSTLSNITGDNAIWFILELLTIPLPGENEKDLQEKRDFMIKLYKLIPSPTTLSNITGVNANHLIRELLTISLPGENEKELQEKRVFIIKLYEWASNPLTMASITDQELLKTAILKAKQSVKENEPEKKNFIRALVKGLGLPLQ